MKTDEGYLFLYLYEQEVHPVRMLMLLELPEEESADVRRSGR